jgi:hypothetical protein
VFAVLNSEQGNYSLPTVIKTTSRTPKWSDLVEAESGGEVDVARIQMLYFTLIAAAFVLHKITVSYEIPNIPEGMLLLMGISNGIYLTSKFLPNRSPQ